MGRGPTTTSLRPPCTYHALRAVCIRSSNWPWCGQQKRWTRCEGGPQYKTEDRRNALIIVLVDRLLLNGTGLNALMFLNSCQQRQCFSNVRLPDSLVAQNAFRTQVLAPKAWLLPRKANKCPLCGRRTFFSRLFELSRWKLLIRQVNKPFRAHSDQPSGPKPSEASASFFILLYNRREHCRHLGIRCATWWPGAGATPARAVSCPAFAPSSGPSTKCGGLERSLQRPQTNFNL